MYGKQTETAIAAVRYLAELWQGHATRRVSAADIADARGLQRPFVAKLLSALSQAGIVSGSPGPGGGYALAKPPADIRLRDVWLVFERPDNGRSEPSVPGDGRPCPIQQGAARVQREIDRLLDETTFDAFVHDVEAESDQAPLGGRLADPKANGHSLNGHGAAGG